MTEEEWLKETDTRKLLAVVQRKLTNRKERLLACAWCRYLWQHLNPALRKVVDIAERFADRNASPFEMMTGRVMVSGLVYQASLNKVYHYVEVLAERSFDQSVEIVGFVNDFWGSPYFRGEIAREPIQPILRHITGNPFRPYPAPAEWPTNVVELADPLYHGADCSFALHDALLETGHAGLAEHFREPAHPKGCWALDLILGKQ